MSGSWAHSYAGHCPAVLRRPYKFGHRWLPACTRRVQIFSLNAGERRGSRNVRAHLGEGFWRQDPTRSNPKKKDGRAQPPESLPPRGNLSAARAPIPIPGRGGRAGAEMRSKKWTAERICSHSRACRVEMRVLAPLVFVPLPCGRRRRPGRSGAGKRRPRRTLLAPGGRRTERRRPKMAPFAPSRVSPGSAHQRNSFFLFGQIRSTRGNLELND